MVLVVRIQHSTRLTYVELVVELLNSELCCLLALLGSFRRCRRELAPAFSLEELVLPNNVIQRWSELAFQICKCFVNCRDFTSCPVASLPHHLLPQICICLTQRHNSAR
jgi:hypothetical protein